MVTAPRMTHYQPLPRLDPPPFWRDDLLPLTARKEVLQLHVYPYGTMEYDGVIAPPVGPPAIGIVRLVMEQNDAIAAEKLRERGMTLDFRGLIFADIRDLDLERLVREAKGLPTSPGLPLRKTAIYGACAFDTSEALIGQMQPLFRVEQLMLEQGSSPVTISRRLVKACIGATVERYRKIDEDLQWLKARAAHRNFGTK